jgi:peptidoglycan/LPS O-acetylase OafA/YrhL
MKTGLNQSGGALPALTSIRFIAAFAVVISHFSENGLLPLPAPVFDFIDGGRSAVSLFFVLSGFILTFTYRDKLARDGHRAFYEARIARIYPVILLGLVLCIPVVTYLLYTDNTARLLDWYALKRAVYPSIVISLACQLLLINAWFPFSAISQPWNGPSVSVSCEAFFYALFPFLMRWMAAMRPARLTLACIALWLATGAWIVLLHVLLPLSRSSAMTYSLPVTRLADFVLGIYAAMLFNRLRATGVSQHARGMLLVGVSVMVLVVLSVWRPVSPSFFLDAPLFAALILGLAMLERPVLGLLNWRPLIRLGEASYSLFLLHMPIAFWSLMMGFGPSNGWMMLVFCLLASLVSFRFYEEPMRKRVKAHFARTPAPARETASGQSAF